MARRRHYGTIEVTVDVDVSDVLDDLSDDDIIAECKARELVVGADPDTEAQAPLDADFLEDLARTLEMGRQMDRTERTVAALRLREMIAPGSKRSARIQEAYQAWQASRAASASH